MGLLCGSQIDICQNYKKQPVLLFARDTLIAIGREETKKIILGGSEHDGCTLTQPYTYTKTAMITLTRIFKTNNYVFKKLCRPPPVKDCFFSFTFIHRRFHYGRLFKSFPGDNLPSQSY